MVRCVGGSNYPEQRGALVDVEQPWLIPAGADGLDALIGHYHLVPQALVNDPVQGPGEVRFLKPLILPGEWLVPFQGRFGVSQLLSKIRRSDP